MLAGDNSILQKATTAKENTERAEIVENAKLDVLNELTGNKGNDLQESQLKSVLEQYFINSEIPEELPSDLSTLELTTLNNKYKIKVSEIYDGNFIKEDISPTVLAKDKLIINPFAENDYEKSPYVNYPSSKGTILCRAMYNDDTNGLQIVSVNPVRKVKLGQNDDSGKISGNNSFQKSVNSYNRATQTLNEYAEQYIDVNGIADDARCVGSNPEQGHKNDETESSDKNTAYGTVSLKNTETLYTTDFNNLKSIGALKYNDNTYGDYYWLAGSRVLDDAEFNIKAVENYEWSEENICNFLIGETDVDGDSYGNGAELGFRPVFFLNSNVKILSGEGTIDSPYEIGI